MLIPSLYNFSVQTNLVWSVWENSSQKQAPPCATDLQLLVYPVFHIALLPARDSRKGEGDRGVATWGQQFDAKVRLLKQPITKKCNNRPKALTHFLILRRIECSHPWTGAEIFARGNFCGVFLEVARTHEQSKKLDVKTCFHSPCAIWCVFLFYFLFSQWERARLVVNEV